MPLVENQAWNIEDEGILVQIALYICRESTR